MLKKDLSEEREADAGYENLARYLRELGYHEESDRIMEVAKQENRHMAVIHPIYMTVCKKKKRV